jgi:cytochrome c oxidase subunit 1
VASTAGATLLAFGFAIILVYLVISLKHGPVAGPNPWRSRGFEWATVSPPPTDNFGPVNPVFTDAPHEYTHPDQQPRPEPEVPHAT